MSLAARADRASRRHLGNERPTGDTDASEGTFDASVTHVLQSADARRGDNIINALGEFLFDRYDVDIRDILRATEWNPFQLYREPAAEGRRSSQTG